MIKMLAEPRIVILKILSARIHNAFAPEQRRAMAPRVMDTAALKRALHVRVNIATGQFY